MVEVEYDDESGERRRKEEGHCPDGSYPLEQARKPLFQDPVWWCSDVLFHQGRISRHGRRCEG